MIKKGFSKNKHLWIILFLALILVIVLYSNFSALDQAQDNEEDSLLGQYNDTAQCSELPGTEQDFCYYWVAFVRANASICGNLANLSQKDFCFKQVALRNYSPETCMNITSEKEKEFCLYILELRKNETLYPDY